MDDPIWPPDEIVERPSDGRTGTTDRAPAAADRPANERPSPTRVGSPWSRPLTPRHAPPEADARLVDPPDRVDGRHASGGPPHRDAHPTAPPPARPAPPPPFQATTGTNGAWPQVTMPFPPAVPGAPQNVPGAPQNVPGAPQNVPGAPQNVPGAPPNVPGAPPAAPPAPPAPGVPPEGWTGAEVGPTAEEFARRRATRPADPVATTGLRGALRRGTLGLITMPPNRREQEHRVQVERVRRNFGGLRQVTVVNPKGGAGKTVAVLLLAMTFGQKRGGYVLAWDNNETQGTLGMRAQQDFHTRTVRDLLRDLNSFQGAQGRVGDLSQYVRAQGEGMFDVLASDESATAGEMLTAGAFGDLREVVSRFYKLIVVDTGNNVRAQNWQAAIDATDQLVVTMSGRNDSAETAARMLDHLEQHGRYRLVRQAVSIVSMPPSRRDLDIPAIIRHFAARTRTVLLAPYEKIIDSGEPIRYAHLSSATRTAWLKIAAAVADGL